MIFDTIKITSIFDATNICTESCVLSALRGHSSLKLLEGRGGCSPAAAYVLIERESEMEVR